MAETLVRGAGAHMRHISNKDSREVPGSQVLTAILKETNPVPQDLH